MWLTQINPNFTYFGRRGKWVLQNGKCIIFGGVLVPMVSDPQQRGFKNPEQGTLGL